MAGEFLGKYRGTVVSVNDPLNLGRVQVDVPEVLGQTRQSWAMPCVPYAGKGVGLIARPPPGTNIWVEFEAGDPDYPIWVGCFWGQDELPRRVAEPGVAVIRVGDVTLVAGDVAAGEPVRVTPADSGSATPVTEVTVSGASLVVSRSGDPILTIDRDTVSVRLAPLELVLSVPDGSVRLGQQGCTVTVAADSAEIAQGSAKARVSADGVGLSAGAAAANVSSSALALQLGSASLTLAAGTVSINDGALEVT